MQFVRKFHADESGAIVVAILVLLPVILMIAGIATDISLLNAQKRYVQGQADLSASSAVFHLGSASDARTTARKVASANDRFIADTLPDEDIEFGSYSEAAGFVPLADQSNPGKGNAIRVTVSSQFEPILLKAFMNTEDLTIRRSAVSQTTAIAAFMIRNRLLSVNTREGILDALLGNILGLNVSVLDYNGLASLDASIDDLLGIISLEAGVDAVTFGDLLGVNVGVPRLLGGLADLGLIPNAITPTGGSISLGDMITLSPLLADLSVGDVLPDVKLNVFDLLTLFAGLANSDPTQRLSVNAGLDLGPLASVTAKVGLIRAGVIAVGSPADVPQPTAAVAQVDVNLTANVLSLIKLEVAVPAVTARATLTGLSCGATGNNVLADFDVQTAAAGLGLSVNLLNIITVGTGSTASQAAVVPIIATSQKISVRANQLNQPVQINNPILLSSVTGTLGSLLSSLKISVQGQETSCGLLGLTCLLNGVLSLLGSVVGSLTQLIAQAAQLDAIVQSLLNLLGIQAAQADLIVYSVSCSGELVQ